MVAPTEVPKLLMVPPSDFKAAITAWLSGTPLAAILFTDSWMVATASFTRPVAR